MSSSFTSDQREYIHRLALSLDGRHTEEVTDLATSLYRWLTSPTQPTSPPSETLRRVARRCEGRLERLASIQQTLAELPDVARGDISSERLGTLLAELASAFADTRNNSDGPLNPPGDALSEFSHLYQNPEFFQQIIDTVGDPLFVKDEKHRWVVQNEASCEFMGYSRDELLGKSDFDFFPDHEARVFWQKDNKVLATGEPDINEEKITDAEDNEHIIITKKTRFIDSQGRKFIVGINRDVTEQRRLEERLEVARRLVSLGTLAGGIAHEVNNPLSYVLTNIEYLLETLDDPEEPAAERKNALEAALRGAHRVQEIVEGLTTFSEASDEDLQTVDVREVLESTVSVAAGDIRRHARLVEDYDDIPPVDANERSLHQIFFNLLVNATEALESDDPEHNEIRVATYTDPGNRAVVEISDTGEGIPGELREQIFDPFFTTKPVGDGTGLGLAICHSLVAALNGHIEVESEPGEGSTFRIVLPPSRNSTDESAS